MLAAKCRRQRLPRVHSGGDRPAFYGDFIEKGRGFIVRVKSRSVLSWNGLHEISFVETTKDIGVDFAIAARFT